jgi:hypothetical protein
MQIMGHIEGVLNDWLGGGYFFSFFFYGDGN